MGLFSMGRQAESDSTLICLVNFWSWPFIASMQTRRRAAFYGVSYFIEFLCHRRVPFTGMFGAPLLTNFKELLTYILHLKAKLLSLVSGVIRSVFSALGFHFNLQRLLIRPTLLFSKEEHSLAFPV